MRIIIVTSKLDLKTGGGSNSDLDLKARAFLKLGDEVTVLTLFSGSNKIPSALPYRLVEEHSRARGLLGIQWSALRMFQTYASQADVFYFDGHNFLYGAGLYRRLGGNVPVVSFFNRELSSWPDRTERFIKTATKAGFADLKRRIRYTLEKYIGIPLANGIDLHTFTSPAFRRLYGNFGLRFQREPLIVGDLFDSESVQKEYAVETRVLPTRATHTKPLTIFFSGRLVAMRGVDLLIQAFSHARTMPDLRLVISGAGPEEHALKELAQNLGVALRIHYTGWLSREEIYQWLIRCDIFIIPKGNGATSVALLEAMAFGLPSIVPDDEGLSWVAGSSGLRFKDGDYQGLAMQIDRLVEDAALRQALVEKGFERLKELDFRKTARRIHDAMSALIKK